MFAKGKIADIKWKIKDKIKKEFKTICGTIELYKMMPKKGLKHNYQLARKIYGR